MSAPSRRLVLTTKARIDLSDLLLYTEQHWGKSQRRVYERLISEALAKLTHFPHLGRSRPDYGPDFLSFRVRQHVVIYQLTETGISIVRLLHVRRDADSEFEATKE